MNAVAPILGPQVPPQLCKFRTYGARADGSDKQVVYDLLRGRLRFSSPASFNDPFEALPLHVLANNDPGEQREAMLRYLAEMAPEGGSGAARRRWAVQRLAMRSPAEWVEYLNGVEEQRRNDSRVFATAHPNSVSKPLLWSHYADSHKGVCIHFSGRADPLRFSFKVEYHAEYPTIPMPRTALENDWELARRSYLTKCDLWSYEEEFRCIRLLIPYAGISDHMFVRWEGDTAICDAQIALELTVGCRMEAPVRDELFAWVRDNSPHVQIWEARQHRARFELERVRLT